MFGIENSIRNCSIEEDQPSPSYWDEEWSKSKDYKLGFENAIMQVREKYELRSKKSLDTSKPKASEITIKKIHEKSSKVTAKGNKSAAESSGKNKEKDNQKNEKKGEPASNTNTSVSTSDTIFPNPVHNEKSQTD